MKNKVFAACFVWYIRNTNSLDTDELFNLEIHENDQQRQYPNLCLRRYSQCYFRLNLAGCMYVTIHTMHIAEWIEDQLTLDVFGYSPQNLKKKSMKLVVTRCTECQNTRLKPFGSATLQSLCLRCSNSINAKTNIDKRSASLREHWATHQHPMTGRRHTEAARLSMSENSKGQYPTMETRQKISATTTERNLAMSEATRDKHRKRMTGARNPRFGKPPSHAKKVWLDTDRNGRVCFRSTWEAAYAKYLDCQSVGWLYEPRTFVMRFENCDISYTPDFYDTQSGIYTEIKGFMRHADLTKITAFRTLHPELVLHVLRAADLREMGILQKGGRVTDDYKA